MTIPTQSRFPRAGLQHHERHIPSQLDYVRIAVFLAVITAIEVAIYYFYGSIARALLIVCLVFLSAIKFAIVVAFFMHLRFDGRLLSFIFVTGIFLAFGAFLVVILTLNGMP
ncbi:MAG TPA: cytochrome C oxidase subunit IV family protein [Chloroflexota bacterium]|jgi:cytochrome c oxidase subunit 4